MCSEIPEKAISLHLCLTLGFCASKTWGPQWGCRFRGWVLTACPGLTAHLQIGNAVLSLSLLVSEFYGSVWWLTNWPLSWLSRDFRCHKQWRMQTLQNQLRKADRPCGWTRPWFPSHDIRNSSFQQQKVPRRLKKQGCTHIQGLPWGSSDFKCTRQRL